MSVQIYQSPSSVSFAGNPILIKAITSLSNKTFLKVCLRLTATLNHPGSLQKTSEFNLSIPTDGQDAVWFNVSSCIQSLFTQVERTNFVSGVANNVASSGNVRFQFKMWDEYLDASNEVISTETSGSVSSKTFLAIPGAFTDAQRLYLPEDSGSMLGGVKLITNKPDSECIPLNERLIISMFSDQSKNAAVVLNGTSSTEMGVFSLRENEIAWKNVHTDSLPVGEYTISVKDTGVRPIIIRVIPEQPFTTYFEFVNRLGGLESIHCFGRRQMKSTIETERNIRYQGMSFIPNGRYTKKVISDEQIITLSTGVISKEWAKWFVQEFFQSEQVWMKDKEIGVMVPVIVELDDDIDLYSETEAQMIDLEFDVVKSINGYITGNHLR